MQHCTVDDCFVCHENRTVCVYARIRTYVCTYMPRSGCTYQKLTSRTKTSCNRIYTYICALYARAVACSSPVMPNIPLPTRSVQPCFAVHSKGLVAIQYCMLVVWKCTLTCGAVFNIYVTIEVRDKCVLRACSRRVIWKLLN